MTIVSASDFRANQGKYFSMANSGEDVILKSREGYFRLIPVASTDTNTDNDTPTKADQELQDLILELNDVITSEKYIDSLERLIDEQ